MTDPAPTPPVSKLEALRGRLIVEQRRFILQAADVDALPPAGFLSRIAQLEGAIVATREMIELEADQDKAD